MKKIFILFLLSISLFMISCKKDNKISNEQSGHSTDTNNEPLDNDPEPVVVKTEFDAKFVFDEQTSKKSYHIKKDELPDYVVTYRNCYVDHKQYEHVNPEEVQYRSFVVLCKVTWFIDDTFNTAFDENNIDDEMTLYGRIDFTVCANLQSSKDLEIFYLSSSRDGKIIIDSNEFYTYDMTSDSITTFKGIVPKEYESRVDLGVGYGDYAKSATVLMDLNGDNILEVVLPSDLFENKTIYAYMFDGAVYLKKVTINGDVNLIEKFAFRKLMTMESFTINGSVDTIQDLGILFSAKPDIPVYITITKEVNNYTESFCFPNMNSENFTIVVSINGVVLGSE